MVNLRFSNRRLGLRSALRHHPAAHLASWAAPRSSSNSGPEFIRGHRRTFYDKRARVPTQSGERGSDCRHGSNRQQVYAPAAQTRKRVRCRKVDASRKRRVSSKMSTSAEFARPTGPGKAMVLSQNDAVSAEPFISVPTSRETRFDSAAFRVLLLRRLQLPLHLSARVCQCAVSPTFLGHHRSACATTGVPGRPGHAVGERGA